MEQKKIIFPRNYKNEKGEEKTFWINAGVCFINFEDDKEKTINLYFDALPFEPQVRVFLKEKDETKEVEEN